MAVVILAVLPFGRRMRLQLLKCRRALECISLDPKLRAFFLAAHNAQRSSLARGAAANGTNVHPLPSGANIYKLVSGVCANFNIC